MAKSRRKTTQKREKERTFFCEICPKSFPHPAALREHMRNHSDQAYKCGKCGSPCRLLGNLKKHFRTHFPINCLRLFNVEWKIFRKNVEICEAKKRRRITDETYLWILECANKRAGKKAKRLPSKRTLKSEKLHPCHLCNKSYDNLALLRNHMVLHKGLVYKCDRCEKASPYLQRKHYRSHFDTEEEFETAWKLFLKTTTLVDLQGMTQDIGKKNNITKKSFNDVGAKSMTTKPTRFRSNKNQIISKTKTTSEDSSLSNTSNSKLRPIESEKGEDEGLAESDVDEEMYCFSPDPKIMSNNTDVIQSFLDFEQIDLMEFTTDLTVILENNHNNSVPNPGTSFEQDIPELETPNYYDNEISLDGNNNVYGDIAHGIEDLPEKEKQGNSSELKSLITDYSFKIDLNEYTDLFLPQNGSMNFKSWNSQDVYESVSQFLPEKLASVFKTVPGKALETLVTGETSREELFEAIMKVTENLKTAAKAYQTSILETCQLTPESDTESHQVEILDAVTYTDEDFLCLENDGDVPHTKSNQCFMNVLCNMLYSIKDIRDQLLTPSSHEILNVIYEIFSRKTKSARELRKLMIPEYHKDEQDVKDVVENLMKELKKIPMSLTPIQFEYSELKECNKCDNNVRTSETREIFHMLISEATFEKSFAKEFVSNQSGKCDFCDGKVVKRRNIIPGKYFSMLLHYQTEMTYLNSNSIFKMFDCTWKIISFVEYKPSKNAVGNRPAESSHFKSWVRGLKKWTCIDDDQVSEKRREVDLSKCGVPLVVFEKLSE